MTNTDQNKLSVVHSNSSAKDTFENQASALYNEQRPNFLEKILNDKSYDNKDNKEPEGFRTKILQDRSNQKECGVSWSKSFVR